MSIKRFQNHLEYGVLKKFMGREYMGVMRSTFLVDEKGKIFKIYPKVKPAGHSKEVLDDFKISN